MYLYDKNMVVTTNHKYAELPWEWEYPWGFPFPFPWGFHTHGMGMGMGKIFSLWGFPQDSYGNGNGNSIPTATVAVEPPGGR